jgi:predicted RNA-binding protein with PUA-like domain
MRYWLFKSEPGEFSFDDLVAAPARSTGWDGVRNYQARNFLRDEVKVGDGVLYYHSGVDMPAIAGIAEVTRAGHPDPTAFEAGHAHFDPKSDRAAPKWFRVTIRAVSRVEPAIGLDELRGVAALSGMELLRRGSRLSIQPVHEREWAAIVELAGGRVKPVGGRGSRGAPR